MLDQINKIEKKAYSVAKSNAFHYIICEDYTPKNTKTIYQTKADLQAELVAILPQIGYEFVDLAKVRNASTSDADWLVVNLRQQLERINQTSFSNEDWDHIYTQLVNPEKDSLTDKLKRIQTGDYQEFLLANGKRKNIYLYDRNDLNNNHLQMVVNYQVLDNYNTNRSQPVEFDCVILMNGLPMVILELMSNGHSLKNAFNKTTYYQQNLYYAGHNKLFGYVHMYVISNGQETRYYSNNLVNSKKLNAKKKNSFDFTIEWSDAKNKKIQAITDFAETFLCKRNLLQILINYFVFACNEELFVLRPYQIAAVEKMLDKIHTKFQNKKYLNNLERQRLVNGYIWHSTGSGKTLTSFKAAQIIVEKFKAVKKVFFIVDRLDLNDQTLEEFEKFQEGSSLATFNIDDLAKKIADTSSNGKIIITTIQKLSRLVQKQEKITPEIAEVFNQDVVLIFDECHRSQFGKMHNVIIKKFKSYSMFGFTGTPIFSQAYTSKKIFTKYPSEGGNNIKETSFHFGDCLHTYNLGHACKDRKVLPFSCLFINTYQGVKDNYDEEWMLETTDQNINHKKTHAAPKRIQNIVTDILQRYPHDTLQKNREQFYTTPERTNSFNAMLAVQSVEQAILYYQFFQAEIKKRNYQHFKVALIYSNVNQQNLVGDGGLGDENNESSEELTQYQKSFLEDVVVQDYNQHFQTQHTIKTKKGFLNYYRSISKFTKERKIDLLIVVNMFLTGFDAPCVNTLYVDKFLKMHGLIQAFSRTNRIFSEKKTCGKIVSFRGLINDYNLAINIYADDAEGESVRLKGFDYYFFGGEHDPKSANINHKGYLPTWQAFVQKFPIEKLDELLKSKKQQELYIWMFNIILRLESILQNYFDESDPSQDFVTQRQKYVDEKIFQFHVRKYQEIRSDFYKYYKYWMHEQITLNEGFEFENNLINSYNLSFAEIIAQYEKIHLDWHDARISYDEFKEKAEEIIDQPIIRSKKEIILHFLFKNDEKYEDEQYGIKNGHSVGELKNWLEQELHKEIAAFTEKWWQIRLKSEQPKETYENFNERITKFLKICWDHQEFYDYGQRKKEGDLYQTFPFGISQEKKAMRKVNSELYWIELEKFWEKENMIRTN